MYIWKGKTEFETKVNVSEEAAAHKGHACCYMKYSVLSNVMNQRSFSGNRK
jgi:hypothetical protein